MVRVSAALKPTRWVPPFSCVDIIGKGKEIFCITIVVLQRDFKDHVGFFDFDHDRFVKRGLGLIQVFNKRDNSATVTENLLFLLFTSLIRQTDGSRPLLRKASSRRRWDKHIKAELNPVSNICISGLNVILVPRFLTFFLSRLEMLKRFSSLVPLFEDLFVLPYFQLEPL